MAKLSLYIMSRVEPEVDWQIVSSDEHSTCWDGGHRIFDMNYMAITRYSAFKTFTVAGGVLPVSEWMSEKQQQEKEEEGQEWIYVVHDNAVVFGNDGDTINCRH